MAPPRGEIFDQSVELKRYQVIIVFLILGLVLFIATLDTTCVSTALPAIAADLNAGQSVTWVGTSLLVASTTTQVISSRLSDIFGRKLALLASIGIFAVGNLLCGFAQTAGWLYAARGVAGLGAGGINSLTLIVIADVVSLADRGKYLSLMGIPVALGLGLGPEVGGAFAQHASWRWVFWITLPPSVLALPIIAWLLPLKAVPGSVRDKLKTVDWAGCVLSLAAIVLILIPVSAGGTAFAWNSAQSIAMLTFGGLLLLAFVAVEKRHPLPILPLHLFTNRTVACVLATMFLVGIVWFGNQFMTPLYLQNVLSLTPVLSGALMLPYLVGQVIVMTAAGYAMKRWGRTRWLILAGYAIFTAGQGIQVAWTTKRDIGIVLGAMAVQGVGFGLTSQTTLVLAQASCESRDRAVVTGARNLFRSSGGAAGLALGTAIVNHVFSTHLPSGLDPTTAAAFRENGFSRDLLDEIPSEGLRSAVVHAYWLGVRGVFVLYVPVMAGCFLLCLGTKDAALGVTPQVRPTAETREETGVEMAVRDKSELNGTGDRDDGGGEARGCAGGEGEDGLGDKDRVENRVDDRVEDGVDKDRGNMDRVDKDRVNKDRVNKDRVNKDSGDGGERKSADAAAHIKLPEDEAEGSATAPRRFITRQSSRKRMSRAVED